MMVSLFYGTGLRMNELRNIKLTDIDSQSYQIKVVAGKGSKDRFTLLPKNLFCPGGVFTVFFNSYKIASVKP